MMRLIIHRANRSGKRVRPPVTPEGWIVGPRTFVTVLGGGIVPIQGHGPCPHFRYFGYLPQVRHLLHIPDNRHLLLNTPLR
jgi:hypothetical protein